MKLLTMFVAAMLLVASGAQGQAPVTKIVAPYAAGGTADFLARTFAEKLRPLLGGAVIVENRPGANGSLGAQYVAKSAPDGTTLLLPGPSVIVINPHIYKNLAYDPLNDLLPVVRVTVSASALFVAASNPANNAKEFVAWAQTQNRPLRFGSAGVGGVTHIWIELFRDATKVPTIHVPYKGVSPATVDLIGGQIDAQFSDVAPLMPMVKAGKVKMIGIVGPQRNPTVPAVPTFAEQGFPGIDGVSWYGLFAPAKTPAAAVNRIAEAASTALNDPKFVSQLAEVGMAATFLGPADFAKLVRDDTEWWGKVVAAHRIVGE